MNRNEWLLKRNCCLTPRQLAIAFGMLCLASFSVALVFSLQGAWFIFLFSVLEMSAVALAFLHYARHATDCEHIELRSDCLLVELIEAGRKKQFRFDPNWTRVALPTHNRELIRLEAKGISAEVGRFVSLDRRRQFAQELRTGLSLQQANF